MKSWGGGGVNIQTFRLRTPQENAHAGYETGLVLTVIMYVT